MPTRWISHASSLEEAPNRNKLYRKFCMFHGTACSVILSQPQGISWPCNAKNRDVIRMSSILPASRAVLIQTESSPVNDVGATSSADLAQKKEALADDDNPTHIRNETLSPCAAAPLPPPPPLQVRTQLSPTAEPSRSSCSSLNWYVHLCGGVPTVVRVRAPSLLLLPNVLL